MFQDATPNQNLFAANTPGQCQKQWTVTRWYQRCFRAGLMARRSWSNTKQTQEPFFFALFGYFLFILSFLFICLFVFTFIFVFPSSIIVFLKRDKKHKVGWIENWKGIARSWGRQQHDQNVLYTFIK